MGMIRLATTRRRPMIIGKPARPAAAPRPRPAPAGTVSFLEVPGGMAFDVPPERALSYFRAKGLRTTFSYADMMGAAHDQAFTVAKLMDVDLLAQVRESLNVALAKGTPMKEWAKDLQPQLERAGWWGRQRMVDPLTGKTKLAQLGSAWRLEIIFRTNMQTAYAAQAWAEIDEQADLAPYLIYDAVDDEKTRAQHRAWDRKVLPVSHPWWRTHYPPNGYGCRCGVIQVSRDDLAAMGLRPTKAPPASTFQWRNPRTGKVSPVPTGIDPGFDRNVGTSYLDTLRQLLSEKLRKAPASTRQAARKALRDEIVRRPGRSSPGLAPAALAAAVDAYVAAFGALPSVPSDVDDAQLAAVLKAATDAGRPVPIDFDWQAT
jgi:SPP1 gp7 family putative phage head morphogenesis protein